MGVRSYLLDGVVVIMVIIMVLAIILNFSPELKKQAEDFVSGVFGFVSDDQELAFNEDAFESWTKSFKECSGDDCFCDFKRGSLLEGNQIFVTNEEDGISLTLFDTEKTVVKSSKIVGKKLALMQRVYDQKNNQVHLVCVEEDLLLVTEDNVWIVKEKKKDMNDFSSGDHSSYPRAKSLYVKGNTLCLVTEKIEVGEGEVDKVTEAQLKDLLTLSKLESESTGWGLFQDSSASAKNFVDSVKACNPF